MLPAVNVTVFLLSSTRLALAAVGAAGVVATEPVYCHAGALPHPLCGRMRYWYTWFADTPVSLCEVAEPDLSARRTQSPPSTFRSM